MKYQYYIYLSSTDDIKQYPLNNATDFNVRLGPEINIPDNESWSCAVTELIVIIASDFALCSDIIEGVHLGNKQLPILRMFHPMSSGTKHLYTFVRPYYVKLRKDLLDSVNMYLTDSTGKKISLSSTTLQVTLHLRKNTPWQES